VRDLPALIKHVGRGTRLAKDLELDEAREVMRAIAAGEADAYQTGAFLMAMRMKSESPAELAGFVLALREQAAGVPELPGAIDVDLHADGREGRPSLAFAAACIAAAGDVRVLVRGWFANRFARNDVGEALARLGVDPARGLAAIGRAPVAVIDLESYAPRIAELLALRERLGVRTCVHSAVKLLDPAATRRPVVGIFHSPYHAPVAGAARLLQAERALVVQAAGGVPEISPDKPTRVSWVAGGEVHGPETTGAAPGPPSGPLDPAETAADLAALLEAVLEGRGPAGATRAAVMTAAAYSWVAGRGGAVDDPSLISEAYEALRDGRAARVLADLRLCYTG
jgi:anthranilate phosphoribosyltransferase